MTGASCGACKFLRRKCNNGCVFAPYFCYDQGSTHFAAVHKVFGASNVSKLLSHLPVHNRSEAAITISYEALARMRDPIYGCVAHIFALQQQVTNLQEEIEFLETQVAFRATDVVSHRRPEVVNNCSNGFQFSLQQDDNAHNYCNQQAPHPSNATGFQAFNQEINIQPLPLCRWEDPSLSNELNFAERLTMGMDQEILPSDPWLDNATYIEF